MRSAKKVFAMILTIVLLMAPLSIGVSADANVSIVLDDAEVEVGTQTVGPTLVYSSTESIGNGKFIVTFPADKLELKLFGDENDMCPIKSAEVNVEYADEGRIIVAFANADGLKLSGVLLFLQFDILNPDVEDSMDIKVQFTELVTTDWVNLVTSPTSHTYTRQVKVQDPESDPSEGVPGDVDGDNEVTSTDARLVLQYVALKISDTDLDLSMADVDGDGGYTSTDARLILQYVAGKITGF